MKSIEIGKTFSFTEKVTDNLSAIHVGSGSVPVLGTPAMIALMEHASNKLVDPYFDEGETSVGIHLEVNHIRATAIGKEITVFAKLTENNDNKRLTFDIWAEEDGNEIGRGVLKRAVINTERFMSKLK